MIRALLLAAGVSGAAGVALSAAASHVLGGGVLVPAGQFLLFHAPVFLALAALHKEGALPARLITLVTGLFALGLVLFAGDLAMRVFLSRPFFANAAPMGGMMLIAGWLVVAVGGVIFVRR